MEGRPCMICQQVIMDRGCAQLKCGHCFHLDCIGSAFDAAMGVMRCPNCGRVENGEWRWPQGYRPVQGNDRSLAARTASRAQALELYIQGARSQRREGSSSEQPQGGSGRQSHG